jgi:hypothetical protein
MFSFYLLLPALEFFVDSFSPCPPYYLSCVSVPSVPVPFLVSQLLGDLETLDVDVLCKTTFF